MTDDENDDDSEDDNDGLDEVGLLVPYWLIAPPPPYCRRATLLTFTSCQHNGDDDLFVC